MIWKRMVGGKEEEDIAKKKKKSVTVRKHSGEPSKRERKDRMSLKLPSYFQRLSAFFILSD